jgi:hypothetical protein
LFVKKIITKHIQRKFVDISDVARKATHVLSSEAKYLALENQYQALSIIVQSSDSAKETAGENISKTKSDKDMMEQEQKNKEDEIKKWEE